MARKWHQRLALGAAAIVILLGRGWGAHRQVHYEDALAVAAVRSQGWWASLDDVGYGVVIQVTLVRLVAWLPPEVWSVMLFAVATAVWTSCAIVVAEAVRRATDRPVAGWLAGVSVVLVPLPELAGQGRVINVLWPLFVAAAIVIGLDVMPRSRMGQVVGVMGLALVAASSPAAVAFVPVLAWRVARRPGRATITSLLAVVAGAAVSLAINVGQDPPLGYLGRWVPDTPYEIAVRDRLEGAGAAGRRPAGLASLPEVLAAIPGSAKYVAATFVPEPWQSDWILVTSSAGNGVRLGVVLLVLALPWLVARRRSASATRRGSLQLVTLALLAVAVPLVINGSVQSRQYVIAPMMLLAIACVVALAGVTHRGRDAAPAGPAVVLLLGAVYGALVWGTFRDPFRETLHRDRAGTYAPHGAWSDALAEGRRRCRGAAVSDVVVISQYPDRDPDADFPVLIRCGEIGGGRQGG